MASAPSLASLETMSADALRAELASGSENRVAIVRTAAEGGIAQAQIVLGQMFLDGIDVPADHVAAFNWFNRAAAQHDMFALNMVGRCYELGWGTAIDMDRACHCFRIAAEQGLAEAMYNFATRLTLGEGVKQDLTLALSWFRRAAAEGHGLIAAKAENYIGSFYEDGWSILADRSIATDHYRHAAEGGDFRGQFNLARVLAEDGRTAEALQWLAKIDATATPTFLSKAITYLHALPGSKFRDEGLAMLRSNRSSTFEKSARL